MNEQERSEFEQLKRRHAQLEQELSLLAKQLKVLELQLSSSPAKPAQAPSTTEPAKPIQPGPVLPLPSEIPKPPVIPKPEVIVPKPAPIPAPISTVSEPLLTSEPGAPPVFAQTAVPPAPPIGSVASAVSSAPPLKKASFEMRLGTYWLVRIGIVMVLTGLVFFANLAYHKVILGLSPAGKVSLLYLASGLLLGAGAWWQRKAARESLRNYAQVLFAGGLAAVYFTTYAAYHVPKLQVITSASLDGALLLAWAGFIAWIADRRKSELLALFAVGLAYYTSVITPVEKFTLYSNLLLAATAVFFLVRNRWAGLSWASLIATYASYAFWRFYHGGEGWRWATPNEGLWFGASFLFSYWLIFTIAVFLSKHERIAGERRAAFLTFNNGALFTLFLLTMLQVDSGKFWLFSLSFGSALLVLAVGSRMLLAAEPLIKNTYITQGLVLVTVGFISKYLDTPRTLALVLAAESVILFILGTLQKNIFLQTGAYISGAMAVGWGIDGLERNDSRGLWLGTAIGAMMLVNVIWSHWRTAWADRREVRPVPAYFTALALIMWAFTTWQNSYHAEFGSVLVIEAALLTLSIYVLRVPEIPLLAQGYILIGQISWGFDAPKATALQFALILSVHAAAALRVGWERRSAFLRASAYCSAALAVAWGIAGLRRDDPQGLWLGAALGAIMAAKAYWMHRRSEGETQLLRPAPAYFSFLALLMWLATTWFNTRLENFPLVLALEAALLTASLYVLRVRELTVLSQGYLVFAQVVWLVHHLAPTVRSVWWKPLALIGLTLGVSHWWQKQKRLQCESSTRSAWQALYALALVALFYVWLHPRTEAATWIALTSILAVGLTAYGVFTRLWAVAICGQLLLAVSIYEFITQLAEGKPAWHFPFVPIAALALLSFSTALWFQRKPDASANVRDPLLRFAQLYRWTALLMSLWWVWEYIPSRERIWVFVLLGFVAFLLAGRVANQEALLFGSVFTLAGFGLFWLPLHDAPTVYWLNLVAILIFLGQQRIAKAIPARYALPQAVQATIIVVGGLSLWLYLTRWVMLNATGGFYLTASWSGLALALFAAGIILGERVYRWLGLGVLACALGRVVIFDVWKLETLYRILSFMALGIVLLVLGFIYNKYQERIRQWL
jgi:uncharacterized membrane protein